MAPKILQLFIQLVNEDANSHTIGAAVSRMGISISQRLLQLGEKNWDRRLSPTACWHWAPWPGMK